jgi:hypothetical protein
MTTEVLDRSDTVGLVTCPNCRVTMRRIVMKPVKGEAELREALYQCPLCDTETTRWVSP